jgi:methionyl-tRNA formyltransferase
MAHFRIGLCALTGFGNVIANSLVAMGHRPNLIVTRRELNSFPYYPEVDLEAEAARLGIPCFIGAEGEARIALAELDLLLVATYHRILGERIVESVKCALNIHPSLLPSYRGPNPFFWVLRNGEAKTGLTIHHLSTVIDGGAIVWQRALEIRASDNQGMLRRRLAELAATALPQIISQSLSGTLFSTPQLLGGVSYWGKPQEADRTLDPQLGLDHNLRIARAAMPYPGALVDGQVADAIIKVWKGTVVSSAPNVDSRPDRRLVQFSDGAMLLSVHPPQPSDSLS